MTQEEMFARPAAEPNEARAASPLVESGRPAGPAERWRRVIPYVPCDTPGPVDR